MRVPGHTAAPALALAAAGILVPAGLLGFMAHDQVDIGGWIHFVEIGLLLLYASAVLSVWSAYTYTADFVRALGQIRVTDDGERESDGKT